MAHFPGYMKKAVMDEVSQRCPTRTCIDYREFLEDPAVEAVDICLTHSIHREVALAGVSREKPMATDLERSKLSTPREEKRRSMVAENTRFVRTYEIARRLLNDKIIGQIASARTFVVGPGISGVDALWIDWRSRSSEGGGEFFDSV
jgi:predicted dehydrogenase